MVKNLIAAASALALGSSLIAEPAFAYQPAANANSEVKDPSKRVCKSVIPSGSRLSVRTCRTQAEWDREAEKAQQGIMNYSQDHGGDIHPTRGRPGQ